jgi:hypothetical protein
MRHLVLTLIAIGIAGVAAIAATTALLNTPLRIGPAASSTPTASQPGQTQAPGADSAGAKAPPGADTPEDPDKDPYEGIAPEDLPPDLQYDADASVSFPTNT